MSISTFSSFKKSRKHGRTLVEDKMSLSLPRRGAKVSWTEAPQVPLASRMSGRITISFKNCWWLIYTINFFGIVSIHAWGSHKGSWVRTWETSTNRIRIHPSQLKRQKPCFGPDFGKIMYTPRGSWAISEGMCTQPGWLTGDWGTLSQRWLSLKTWSDLKTRVATKISCQHRTKN